MKKIIICGAVLALCLACASDEEGGGAVLIVPEARDPDCGPGNLVAYMDDFDIYYCDAYGGNRRRVTASPRIPKYHPRWSPDGAYIVYETYGVPEGGVFVVPRGGGDPVRIAPYQGRHPVWSPDGRRIAYCHPDGYDIWTVPAAGGEPERLTSRGACFAPVWSPDGKRIYFIGRDLTAATGPYYLWAVNVETGRTVRLWSYPGFYFDLDASPDGRWLACVFAGDGGAPDVWFAETKTGRRYRLTDEAAAESGGGTFAAVHSPSWAEDGSAVFFQSNRSSVAGIYRIDLGD